MQKPSSTCIHQCVGPNSYAETADLRVGQTFLSARLASNRLPECGHFDKLNDHALFSSSDVIRPLTGDPLPALLVLLALSLPKWPVEASLPKDCRRGGRRLMRCGSSVHS